MFGGQTSVLFLLILAAYVCVQTSVLFLLILTAICLIFTAASLYSSLYELRTSPPSLSVLAQQSAYTQQPRHFSYRAI
ncbi:hypothetical protein GDO81_027245 [Engystomops pustulosus]|uniref:Uncharacterized protein n=1 Tax=Engystomops pustulosus TaxID=76066 RepID=A0AAV6YPT1_ENGPU|nr:hypothetical protein GDO81_027245 [Engystomops pustulosus]